MSNPERHMIVGPDESRAAIDLRIGVLLEASSVPIDVDCGQCSRRLGCATVRGVSGFITDGAAGQARGRRGLHRLADADYCRWCAVPISARAQKLAPVEGYIAFAHSVSGERRPAVGRGAEVA